MKLPEEFKDKIKPLIKGGWDNFEKALGQDAYTSFRINPIKSTEFWIPSESVDWCKNGYYLDDRPSFVFDPLFHSGAYYVQEASSMFIGQVFEQYIHEDVKVLDLCAAPGGKSTHILSLLSEDSLLVSNEVIKSRANILSENMTKWGYPNSIVINNDPSEIGNLSDYFDVILVDAPCSGEGMFRKDSIALEEWSPANVQLCKERQQRILKDIWSSLKPGGILIYSTCTYNREENEDNVLWIKEKLGAQILPVETDPKWGISPSYDADLSCYHFFPHKTKGEGFFMAVVQKDGEFTETTKAIKNRKQNKQKPAVLADKYKNYLTNSEQYTFFNRGETWFAFPQKQYDNFNEVSSKLRLISAGINIGEFKGEKFIPHHSLAMSTALNKNSFICHDINLETAITYLRNETFLLTDLPKGYILLTYKNVPLGFVKNIGNRINNLYPSEWRIRKTYQNEAVNSPLKLG